jgi:UDP-N-acetylmuramate--alanine ligase
MKKRLGNVVLNVPARHNVLNSLACFGVMMAFGAGFETVRDLIKDFRSVKRRFEIKYDENGIMLVEDYAHHPTEIKSVIDIARKLGRKRIVAVFQPHRYSRTVYLQDEFSVAFDGIDELILTDIYAGNEKHVDGVSAVTLMDRISPGSGVKASIARKSDIPDRLGNSLNEGDILLVMGAGDVNQVIEGIAERLRRRFHDRVS